MQLSPRAGGLSAMRLNIPAITEKQYWPPPSRCPGCVQKSLGGFNPKHRTRTCLTANASGRASITDVHTYLAAFKAQAPAAPAAKAWA